MVDVLGCMGGIVGFDILRRVGMEEVGVLGEMV